MRNPILIDWKHCTYVSNLTVLWSKGRSPTGCEVVISHLCSWNNKVLFFSLFFFSLCIMSSWLQTFYSKYVACSRLSQPLYLSAVSELSFVRTHHSSPQRLLFVLRLFGDCNPTRDQSGTFDYIVYRLLCPLERKKNWNNRRTRVKLPPFRYGGWLTISAPACKAVRQATLLKPLSQSRARVAGWWW